jgi:ketosteroid isomerase-like protein
VSEENVEIVRRVIATLREAYKSGDATAELLELCAPDIRVDASRRVFNPDTYEGHAGLRRLIREISEAWEDFSEANERLIDAGDRVVALQTISGRGPASKLEVRREAAVIWTLRDGRIVRVETFLDRREALRTAGLAD